MLYKRTSSMSTMVATLPQQFTLHESVDGGPSLGHSFSQKKKVIMSLVDGINKLIIILSY